MKKFWAVLLTIVILSAAFVPASATKKKNSKGDDNSNTLRSFNGSYQYVQMGTYPYDKKGGEKPVLWRILEVEEGRALLLAEYILDIQQGMYYQEPEKKKKYDYPAISGYAETDLCKWINTEMIGKMFGNNPLYYALLEEGDHGKLFCLTSQQFTKSAYGFTMNKKPAKCRIAVATPYCRSRELYRVKHIDVKNGGSPYWAATKTGDQRLQIVGYDGHLSAGYVHRDNIGIRPGVRLDLSKITIASGSGKKSDPFIFSFTGEIPTETAEPEQAADGQENPEGAGKKTADGTDYEEIDFDDEDTDTDDEDDDEDEEDAEDAEDAAAGEGSTADGETVTEDADARNTGSEETAGEPSAAAGNTAKVSFLGDCSIGDAISAGNRSSSYHAVIDKKGYAWPFSQVQKFIGTDDMTVGNLEIVITKQTKHKNIVFPLRADPDHVNILLEGSIDVVNTANNHCYDFYRNGYTDTLKALDEAGIDHFGSVYYSRDNGFDHVVVKDVNGIRFGFFGFTYPGNNDLKHAKKLIQKLREEEHCDYIVASLHWGRETFLVPAKGNVKYAKQLLDLGADMLYGHHPHVLQPIAFYNNKPILFSTGNCTFGTLSNGMDQHAGIFQLTFEKTESGTVLRRLEVIPCKYYKSGDYRIEEEKDVKEREKTFQILSPGKDFSGCVNPPASFLKTGVILFDEAGKMTSDP